MVQTHHLDPGRGAARLSWLLRLVALLLLTVAILAGLLAAFEYPKFTACNAPAPGGGVGSVAGGPLPDCS